MEISSLTITKLHGIYKAEENALSETCSTIYDRAQKAQEKYDIYITLDKDFLAQVEKVKGKKIEEYPLAGVPVSLGDNICTDVLETTCGSKMMENYVSPIKAFVVDRLTRAGAVITGKTNLDEFGIGDARGHSYFAHSKNPRVESRTAGCGAACAVALGTSLIGLSSDARGALRQSAAYCGVTGLKPTYGRISRYGLIDYASSLDQIGILAMNALDTALILSLVAGKDEGDPTSLDKPVLDYHKELIEKPKGLKIGIIKEWDEVEGLEEEVKKAFEAGLEQLKDMGIEIMEINAPSFFHSPYTAAIIGAVEAFSNLANFDGVRFGFRASSNHLHEMYINTRTEGFGEHLKRFLAFGALASSEKHFQEYFLPAQKMRTRIKDELEEILEEVDMIATPTVPFMAPSLERVEKDCSIAPAADTFTSAANLAGLPSLSVPVKAETMPAGLQLMGRPFQENLLLKVSHALEKSSMQDPSN